MEEIEKKTKELIGFKLIGTITQKMIRIQKKKKAFKILVLNKIL